MMQRACGWGDGTERVREIDGTERVKEIDGTERVKGQGAEREMGQRG